MGTASRAIIIEDDNILVMHRSKEGTEYDTLVGGRISEGETAKQAVIREVKEETGLDVISARLVFTEKHPEPYNDQFIFLCEVAPHGPVAIQSSSEEALMNRIDINIHKPVWVRTKMFHHLPFSTMKLQNAITLALEKGFPEEPQAL